MSQIKSWWGWIKQQDLMVKFIGLRMAARTQKIPVAWKPDRTSLGGIPVASCSASFPSFTLSVGFFLLLLRPRPMRLFVYLVRNIISINISIDFYWRNMADWAKISLSQIQTNHWGKNSLAQLGEESLLTVSMCQAPLGDGNTADYRTDTSVVMELTFSDTVLALCLLLNVYQ